MTKSDSDGLCWHCEDRAASPFDDRNLCAECAVAIDIEDQAEADDRRERDEDLEEKQ